MGKLIRSENSLNQHIKNKHPELWENIKHKAEQVLENNINIDKEMDNKNDRINPDFQNEVLHDDVSIEL